MEKLLVIADDFTGAAEIAGIGHRHGLPTRVLRRPTTRVDNGLTVLDTNSRLLSHVDAARAVRMFVEPIANDHFDRVFKKTDSALRGPIAAELDALAVALGRSFVLLVPQNPSRDRVIVNGEYFIDCVPLHRTTFADDPTHPARTSKASELLGPHATSINIPDAESTAELDEHAARLTPTTLPAGGADFFTALLKAGGLSAIRDPLSSLPPGPRLYVCGSPQPYAAIPNVAARPMMESPEVWCDHVSWLLSGGYDAMMTIDRDLDTSPGAAARIEQHLATVAAGALRRASVRTLFVTGGATAAAVCREMGWDKFDVEGELATGVVQLRPRAAAETALIVKPGSYEWPPQFGASGLVLRSRLPLPRRRP
jgi:D-threonate/D-erythronate kinase